MGLPALLVLDSFARAPENPLSNGGKWSLLNGCLKTGFITEEHWTPASTFAEGEDGAYWNAGEFTNPTLALQFPFAITSNERFVGIWACLSQPGEPAKSGYRLKVVRTAANLHTVRVERCDAGTFGTLLELKSVLFEAKDTVALSVQDGFVAVLRKKHDEVPFHELGAVSDGTYTVGYVGIVGKGEGTAVASNYEGGEADPSGDLLYERTAPLYAADEAPNSLGHTLASSIMSMLQGMDQIVLDADAHPGWTTVLDPKTCPAKWLPWCAQIYGVVLPPNSTSAEQRRIIQELAAQGRGTITAFIAAALPTLTGEKRIFFTERAESKAYKINVHTLTKETPSTAATLAALLSQKPGGIVLTLTVSESPTWEEATKEWHSVGSTITWGNATPGTV